MSDTTAEDDPAEWRRELSRRRMVEYRRRKREGAVLVQLEVGPRMVAAFERLALLDVGERHPDAIAWACWRFLCAAEAVGRLGDALWPEEAET